MGVTEETGVGAFKIAAAQVASVRGDLEQNLRTHVSAVEAAATLDVSVVVFPELSLTGYEPELAAAHPLLASDERLWPLAELARRHRMHVVVGAPLSTGGQKPNLGAVLFGPDGSLQTYAKMRLGGSEPRFFEPGNRPLSFSSHGQTIGLAICADTSRASHPRGYSAAGATVYAAGMFLNAEWYETDAPRLSAYAPVHRLLVVLANHAASVGTYTSVGKSAVWAPGGALLAEAAGTEKALVVATRGQQGWHAAVHRL